MKTCKKTLSLVLVFALVLSVFTYSASADFTDQDEITYEEAAVVLEALGVIDGYEDVTAEPLSTDPTVCLVEFAFTVAHGLNQIWLSAHITV